jgi:hypothetical protein
MVETTSIKLGKLLVEELKKLKVHPRETYEDVIKRVLEEWKSIKSK